MHLGSRWYVLVCACCRAMGKPKNKKSKATEPWEDSKERSDRIERRVEVLLVEGYRCLSQAQNQAERMIDNKKHLKKN